MQRGHSEALLPLVRKLLAGVGVAPCDIALFAVTVGPGAFTGIRIGLAAARAMAVAASVPCIGISSLAALAAAVPDEERRGASRLLAVMDTKREDVYAQAFLPDGAPDGAPVACRYDQLAGMAGGGAVVVVGDAAVRAAAALAEAGLEARRSSAEGLPDPRVIAALALARWQPGLLPPPEPLYLRPPYATAPES